MFVQLSVCRFSDLHFHAASRPFYSLSTAYGRSAGLGTHWRTQNSLFDQFERALPLLSSAML